MHKKILMFIEGILINILVEWAKKGRKTQKRNAFLKWPKAERDFVCLTFLIRTSARKDQGECSPLTGRNAHRPKREHPRP
jgi:hypothetical protein